MAKHRISLTPADFGLMGDREKQRAMRTLGDVILAEWGAQARAAIKSRTMLSAYLKSLAIREVTASKVSVQLPGPEAGKSAVLARMAEFGMGPGGIGTTGPYDIRTFVLKEGTRKLRVGKTGPYVNIPFDMSPGQIEAHGGSKALKMARALHPYGRNLKPEHSVAVDKSGKRRKLRLPAGLAEIGRNPTTGQSHVSDPLEGTVRLTSSYSRRSDGSTVTQTTGYRKWRRMSWAGNPWMHPGVPALHLGEKVAREVPRLVGEVL